MEGEWSYSKTFSAEDRKSRQNKALYAENRDRIGVTDIGV